MLGAIYNQRLRSTDELDATMIARLIRKAASRVIRWDLARTKRTLVSTLRPWAPPDYPVEFLALRKPSLILDIGANEGQFALALRSCGYEGPMISFEPQQAAFAALESNAENDANWKCYNLALGDVTDTVPMHVSNSSQSSSLLPIATLHVDVMPDTGEIGIQPVAVARLDKLAEELKLIQHKIAIKIDVQGFELQVLKGMGNMLSQVDAAVVELNFATLFEGQSIYYEVMACLELAGLQFKALANFNMHPETGDLLWADGLFARAGADSNREVPRSEIIR